METKFYEKWIRRKRSPTALLTLEDARQRHASHQPYVAIFSESGKDLCVVDLDQEGISVYFMDHLQRIYLSYDFRDVGKKGELFLTGAIHREFVGDTEDVSVSSIFNFQTDGKILMEKRDYLAATEEKQETIADPTGNWEKYPEFGHYLPLCRVDRS